MSTHIVPIIEIESVLPHENAERLEIVPVNGWQAVVKKGQFKTGDRAVYIQPDYTVPTARPEFSFLSKEGKDRHRLKAVRLRGALSFGLLIPVPDDLQNADVGECVMERLGVARYEPPMKAFRGGGDDQELSEDECPNVYAPKFDIESIQNFLDAFSPCEEVIVTEKVHGANARYLWHDGKMFLGSRTRWLKPNADNVWSRALTEEMRSWCESHPDTTLFGEVYGPVQSLKYGLSEPRFVAFAALSRETWVSLGELFASLDGAGVPRVPTLLIGPYDFETIRALAEEDSRIGPVGHMMEGVVVTPAIERRDPDFGRVALKHISNRYWESEA
jgi:RNA ligase (TIGR02306 family)